MTQPTGVFVRLPLSDAHVLSLLDAYTGDKETTNLKMEAAILAIGTPVAGGELGVVDYSEYAPEYHDQGMGCGLEDRGIHDRYEAMGYGWDQAIERACSELPETVLLSDALAKLAEKDAEIARLEEAIQHSKRKQFNAGYLLACCNISNMHNEESIASDVLNELGITEDEVKALDLSEYDAKALDKIRKARGHDPILKGSEA